MADKLRVRLAVTYEGVGHRRSDAMDDAASVLDPDRASREAAFNGETAAMLRLSPTQFAKRLLADRRRRETLLGARLFADPAWDMLLDLFIAAEEGRRISASSLCIAAAVPPTTALRWITTMVDEGWFERTNDPTDGRRIFIGLRAESHERMLVLLTAMARNWDVALSPVAERPDDGVAAGLASRLRDRDD